MDEELATLLSRSARGDVQAFGWFYDSTCRRVLALERARSARRASRPDQVQIDTFRAVTARYVQAWRLAGAHASSGLSPFAWLLSLPVADLPSGSLEGTACA